MGCSIEVTAREFVEAANVPTIRVFWLGADAPDHFEISGPGAVAIAKRMLSICQVRKAVCGLLPTRAVIVRHPDSSLADVLRFVSYQVGATVAAVNFPEEVVPHATRP